MTNFVVSLKEKVERLERLDSDIEDVKDALQNTKNWISKIGNSTITVKLEESCNDIRINFPKGATMYWEFLSVGEDTSVGAEINNLLPPYLEKVLEILESARRGLVEDINDTEVW